MTELRNDPEIDLLCELVRCASVTPHDAGCQAILARRLEAMGFECETLVFGEVTNLWARRGKSSPVLCFAGHTDVVPPGDTDAWSTDPFEPTFKGDTVYGRGTADMKSGLAAIVVAIEQFLKDRPEHKGSIALLITSDEEGRARDGTLKVMETLTARGEKIDWCVIGEPSSEKVLGDLVRIGRRGSLSGMLTVKGIQGHVAYPQLAVNPIRRFAPVLAELHTIEWDRGNDYFPPTSFQVVEIQSGIGAPNVTPAILTARFNFRYSTEWTHESLKKRVHEVFDAHDIDYELRWHLSGEPFLTQPGKLIDAVVASVEQHTGAPPELSTGGGTSDGRFISPAGVDVVELGPVNASIHKLDEHVRVADVLRLTSMYRRIMELML
ncbi:MAG: succinyl-diaminopimelate desuccinylase [Gammaproteobacteria bacterium]|nr:succinyl-diaminopimelate desuccinylase [Gammaproteobacteria bacterium]MDH5239504.1 succinyl-diaminopimelate desuccinylase [Gammaproteobacteria bacterium]